MNEYLRTAARVRLEHRPSEADVLNGFENMSLRLAIQSAAEDDVAAMMRSTPKPEWNVRESYECPIATVEYSPWLTYLAEAVASVEDQMSAAGRDWLAAAVTRSQMSEQSYRLFPQCRSAADAFAFTVRSIGTARHPAHWPGDADLAAGYLFHAAAAAERRECTWVHAHWVLSSVGCAAASATGDGNTPDPVSQ